ncbi:MAG: ribF [Chlamydiales bacterium]|jgi:riboflavin kinase/FMN adenylyltransferase|nr:ribF [Chlamydiales bacterium]
MLAVTDLNRLASQELPFALTIGNFDGVHLGHQAVIARLVAYAKASHLLSAVITFDTHPAEYFHRAPLERLSHLLERDRLIEELGVDWLVHFPFDQTIAEMPAEDFLTLLNQNKKLKALVLGHDTAFGKERLGNKEKLQSLSQSFPFYLEHVPCVLDAGKPLSSSLIRTELKEGHLARVQSLLGRPYSLTGQIIPGEQRGRKLGFPTLNIDLSGLCLPPFGVYAVEMPKLHLFGVANLGLAPTFGVKRAPVLEVHLFQPFSLPLSSSLQVILHQFLRPEQKFSSALELQTQIRSDIAQAKALLKISSPL